MCELYLLLLLLALPVICRDTISEGIEGKQADLFEEIGVDTDEAAGVTYALFEKLIPIGGSIKRARSGKAA